MRDEAIHRPGLSTNRGASAIDDPAFGYEPPAVSLSLSCWMGNEPSDILVREEQSHITRPSIIRQQGLRVSQDAESVLTGYYSIAGDGHDCGLCTGMHVRLL